MKHKYIFIGLATLALVAGAALAQDENRAGKMFQKIDGNGDGRITETEAGAFQAERFRRMDTDGDGAVTLVEIEAELRRMAPEQAAKRFERLDGNGDGAITRAEFEARAANRFARMDTNGDGAITREEVQALKGRRGG